jgi:pyridoxine 4-dehydrogenase
MKLHLPATDHGAMEGARESGLSRYAIRVRGHLGATVLSAFPAMMPYRHGADTVLTGPLDRSALHGALAEIEALGLELLEIRQLTPGSEAPEPGGGRPVFALGPLQVRRSGYGAMQLAGPFAFGPPPDRSAAIGVLRAAVAAGVDHIDTAQYYGPGTVNELIRDALYPYPDGLAIVSKVAVQRDDRGAVLPFDEPGQLRQGIEDNLRTLRAGQLAAVNLRLSGDGVIDDRFDDQLAAMVAARDEGLIAGIGLSNCSLGQLQRAVDLTAIACVQNLFHLADRRSAPVLEECQSRGIAFVPFCPLGWPRGADNPVLTSPAVIRTAARLGVTPAQAALAWLLQLAPNVLLIPGTGSVAHLRENLAAEHVTLDGEALRALEGTIG